MRTHLRNAYGTLKKGVPYALSRDIFAYPAAFFKKMPQGTQKCVPSEMRTEMRTNTIYGACHYKTHTYSYTVQYCRASLEKLYEALVEITSTSIAKIRAAAAATFIGILWGAAANAMDAPRAALFSV